MTLNLLARAAYENSEIHGFWDDEPQPNRGPEAHATYLGNKLMLIVGEVSEAHEELRKNTDPRHTYYREDGKPEGVAFELADVLIRVFDLAFAIGVDLDAAVAEKAAYNATRPAKHGKAF